MLTLKSTPRGFTLIELLVVIAIIAIRASILFPVFSRAKEAAKKTTCISNSKQLSLGVVMYADDSDGVYPPTQNGQKVLWPDLLSSYLRSNRVRLCPSDLPGAANSYGLNQLIFVDFTDFLPDLPPKVPAEGDLVSPASTIMLGELGTEDDLMTPRVNAFKLTVPDDVLNDSYDARPSSRHFNQSNLGFFDGHAKSMPLSQFYLSQMPADKWFCLDATNQATCLSQ
jgi:prepilin-type N-terminal cleavage/methylation domain-containing protein/prepilin-type processing-associated H-X9-DG protein